MNLLLADFHFLRPWWLWLLLPLFLGGWRATRRKALVSRWQQLCDVALQPYVVVPPHRPPGYRGWPLFVAALLAIVAMAGPVWERAPQPVYRDQAALVLLLDLSQSMTATDITPSRLARARFRIRDLLALRRAGQTALVVYAAQAFVVTPLTDDVDTLLSQLEILEPTLMPRQGSRPAAAVSEGVALLSQAGGGVGDLLLLTDALPAGEDAAIQRALAGTRHRLSILGLGTAEGAPVPTEGGGFMTREDGALVVARLDAAGLQATALTNRGTYVETTAAGTEIPVLARFLANAARGPARSAAPDAAATDWREHGIWLLPPLLLLAATAFRRGGLLGVLAAVLLAAGTPRAAMAEWFRTPDQQAAEAFAAEDYARAAKTFEDPAWRAASQYRAGDYAAAIGTLAEVRTPEALYNLGNAHARLGEWKDAIGAYESALALRPDFEDARYNLELVRQRVEEEAEKQRQQQDEDRQEAEQERPDPQQGEQETAGEQGRQGKADEGESSDEAGAEDPEGARENRQREAREARQRRAGKEAGEGKADTTSEQDVGRKPVSTEEEAAPGDGDPEIELATEQWLRQIPDDPGGLLRRKFLYQYGRQENKEPEQEEPW